MWKDFFSFDARKKEVIGIILVVWGVFSALALYGGAVGWAGKILADFYLFFFGQLAFFIPFCFAYAGIKFIIGDLVTGKERLGGFILLFFSLLSLYHISYEFTSPLEKGLLGEGGGLIGGLFSYLLQNIFGVTGSQIILFALALIGILFFLDILLKEVFLGITAKSKNIYHQSKEFLSNLRRFNPVKIVAIFAKIKNILGKKSTGEKKNSHQPPADTSNSSITLDKDLPAKELPKMEPQEDEDDNFQENVNSSPIDNFTEVTEDKTEEEISNINPGDRESDYTLPGTGLLKKNKQREGAGKNQSKQLEDTLKNFGVKAKVVNVGQGPTITRYEVEPETGVKVSKVANLSDDIALALAAQDVRIEAPVPGKPVIGIEIPNQGPSLVRFREIVASEEFKNSSKKIPLALGYSIDGKPVIADLATMPHLLIAGATGSGKSVCINSIIASFLYRFTPEQIKLLLIDPKKVEMVNFKGLPHLFTPLVTESKKAAGTLKLIVEEMEKRYELFAETGTRDIYSYNNKAEDPLPYIAVIIDELSDLMMVAASDVEDAICRLAQMSRAAGIHLVIATQRPSVDVITGLIKANIPSRIAFAVSSNTDSRTILDTKGAEKLLGDGDMLFYPVGAKKPHRMQGAYIDNKEIKNIVNFVKEQSDPDFALEEQELAEIDLEIDDDKDELLEDAIKLVVEYRASISMLQRKLHIGHSRAARLIDNMEEMGIVGPYAGSKPREVLISEDELEEYLD